MFICIFTYTAGPEVMATVRPAHIDYLKVQRDAGHYIGWGRQPSGGGGMVFAKGDRAVIEALVANDPYRLGGVATTEVIELNVAFLSPDFVADVTA